MTERETSNASPLEFDDATIIRDSRCHDAAWGQAARLSSRLGSQNARLEDELRAAAAKPGMWNHIKERWYRLSGHPVDH